MVRRETITRAASLFVAALIAVVTVVVVAHASQSIATPNAMQISYNLTIDAASTPITLPVNQAVLLMGSDSDLAQNANCGVGQATISSVTSSRVMNFVSYDVNAATLKVGGVSYGNITNVFYLDALSLVEVRTDGKTFWVFNGDDQSNGPGLPVTHAGTVKMIW